MGNSQTQSLSGLVKKSGDTMSGDLNLGLNSLILHSGGKGGVIRGNPDNADMIDTRNIADTGQGDLMSHKLWLGGDIAMAGDKTVDGVDLSKLADDYFTVYVDSHTEHVYTGDTGTDNLIIGGIAGSRLGLTGSFIVEVHGWVTGNNAPKGVGLRFNGTEIILLDIAASVQLKYWKIKAHCINVGSLTAQIWNAMGWEETLIKGQLCNKASSINTENTQEIAIARTLYNAGDAIYVRGYTIRIRES